MAGGVLLELGHLLLALLSGIGAARVKQAAVRAVVLAGNDTWQRRQTFFVLSKFRQRTQQCLSLWMTRRMEDGVRITGFHHLACIHHDDFMCRFRHQRQVMGN